MHAKRIAGEKATDFVESGMVVGLGTGTTVYWTIKRLGEMIKKDNFHIKVICTSIETEVLASKFGLDITSFGEVNSIDLTIDGADEINQNLHIIKGGGGALFREKIVASSSKFNITVVDESKSVSVLGKFPLPVEVLSFGWEVTSKKINDLGTVSVRREGLNGKPFITDNGNYILDCHFGEINDPRFLHKNLKMITGVIETGLFFDTTNIALIGNPSGSVKVISNTIS
ncbi:ribose 5-phosphate isomerase A [Hazenella sp. IB182357]|uniref:Ribose-5-phosphate isomerase A n=1 Tax=Polycladospora coralii TaxID=2771432 RepID=A0A926NHN1_9BACL|nr:ribose 5-phosphate isomerase A [Polycladospora coralii]